MNHDKNKQGRSTPTGAFTRAKIANTERERLIRKMEQEWVKEVRRSKVERSVDPKPSWLNKLGYRTSTG
jgi:hypothetical protein